MHISEIFIIEFSYTFDLKSYFLNCAKWFSPKYYIDVLYSKWTLSLNRVELMEHRTRAPLLIWPWKVYLRFSSSHLPNNSNDPCELWGLRNCQSEGVNVKKLCTYYEECRSDTSSHVLTNCFLALGFVFITHDFESRFSPHFLNSTNKCISYFNLYTNIAFALGFFSTS